MISSKDVHMKDRAYLHQLVDTLPENVLDTVHRVLEYQQNAPAELTGFEEARKRINQLQQRLQKRHGSFVGETGGSGGISPEGTGQYSVQGYDEDGAHLTLSVRY